MTQLILNIEDASILPSLRKVLANLRGVSIARSVTKKSDPTLMTEEEFYSQIDQAKKQVENGEVGPVFTSAKDLFDYIEAMP